MKLEVGMWVRTKYGISKIVNIFFEKTGVFIETDNKLGNCNMSTRGKLYKGIYILEEDYKTFIDNNVKNTIIDLIEVGDYVNGYIVLEIIKDNLGKTYIECGCKDEIAHNYIYDTFYNEDIKSIVTKEQFSAMEYKIY